MSVPGYECPDLEIGDFITAHQKGYHRVTGLRPGGSSGTIVDYVRVLTDAGKPNKSGALSCCGSFCKKVTEAQLDQMRDAALTRIENIRKALRSES